MKSILLQLFLDHETWLWKFLSEKRDMQNTQTTFVRYYPHINKMDDEVGLQICKHFQGIDERTTCTIVKEKGLEVKLKI